MDWGSLPFQWFRSCNLCTIPCNGGATGHTGQSHGSHWSHCITPARVTDAPVCTRLSALVIFVLSVTWPYPHPVHASSCLILHIHVSLLHCTVHAVEYHCVALQLPLHDYLPPVTSSICSFQDDSAQLHCLLTCRSRG